MKKRRLTTRPAPRNSTSMLPWSTASTPSLRRLATKNFCGIAASKSRPRPRAFGPTSASTTQPDRRPPLSISTCAPGRTSTRHWSTTTPTRTTWPGSIWQPPPAGRGGWPPNTPLAFRFWRIASPSTRPRSTRGRPRPRRWSFPSIRIGASLPRTPDFSSVRPGTGKPPMISTRFSSTSIPSSSTGTRS